MKALRRMWKRMSNLVMGRRGEQRLREEMEEHVRMQTEENLRKGMAYLILPIVCLILFG